jgi:glycosyltransferase involved in cell wall biosynthesis
MEDMESQGRVQVAAVRPAKRRGRVELYAGPVEARPEKLIDEGLGGSETALVKVAEHFALREYDVRVYCGDQDGGVRSDRITVMEQPKMRGQVLYLPAAAWDPGTEADLLVVSRVPEAFDYSIKAKRRALWLHDADYGDRINPERIARATDVIVLSQFQRELLTERYPFLADEPNLLVSRNGIEPAFFEGELPEKKPWVVYSSSPDRGLDVLLECWPQIKEAVPEAELHHFYAPVYNEMASSGQFPHLAPFIERVEALHDEIEAGCGGVVRRGSLGQAQLAEVFKEATVWAYPSWASPFNASFPEISCISAMEAVAAGLVPVTLKHGALPETLAGANAALLDVDAEGPPDNTRPTEKWRAEFAGAVIAALRGEVAQNPKARENVLAEKDWSGVVDDWEQEFLLGKKVRA